MYDPVVRLRKRISRYHVVKCCKGYSVRPEMPIAFKFLCTSLSPYQLKLFEAHSHVVCLKIGSRVPEPAVFKRHLMHGPGNAINNVYSLKASSTPKS